MTKLSQEGRDILRDVAIVDLHVDGMIHIDYSVMTLINATVVAGLRGVFGHLDFPRAAENGLSAAMWSITTNPARGAWSLEGAVEQHRRARRAS